MELRGSRDDARDRCADTLMPSPGFARVEDFQRYQEASALHRASTRMSTPQTESLRHDGGPARWVPFDLAVDRTMSILANRAFPGMDALTPFPGMIAAE